MLKFKLYRNLKPGERFRVAIPEEGRVAVVTVSRVQETSWGHITRKRRWAVHGNYPWWFRGPVVAYANEACALVPICEVDHD